MFILPRASLPDSPAELAEAISAGYRLFFEGQPPSVAVEGVTEQGFAHVAADLTGAVMEKRPSLKRESPGKRTPAFGVGELSLVAQPVVLFGARISLKLQARDVELEQVATAPSEIILFPVSSKSGQLTVDTERADLERLLKRVITRQAGKQGVTVENVALALKATGPRSLRAQISVGVRKLFIQTTVRLSGEVTIDEALVARVHNLHCEGDGNFGTLGCAMLAPHLAKLEARSFPLAAFPMGTITLRDLALEVAGERASLRADFA